MLHDEIIDQLGGDVAVADTLGLDASRPRRWRRWGIPAERWPALVEMARAKGLAAITFEALHQGASAQFPLPARKPGRKPKAQASAEAAA
jgi:hypothetical protein